MTQAELEELLRKLDELGEQEVRKKVNLEHYTGEKMLAVQAWLQWEEEQKQREEELSHLRGAKNAAWVAAIAAILSALFAFATWLFK